MIPSKSTDYGSETSRSFSTRRIGGKATSNNSLPHFQTTFADRHSNSTASTSTYSETYFSNTPFETSEFYRDIASNDSLSSFQTNLDDGCFNHIDFTYLETNFNNTPFQSSEFPNELLSQRTTGTNKHMYESLSSVSDSLLHVSDSDINNLVSNVERSLTFVEFDGAQNHRQTQMCDTSFQGRAIVGRNIYGRHSRSTGNEPSRSGGDTIQTQYELFPQADQSCNSHPQNYILHSPPSSSNVSLPNTVSQKFPPRRRNRIQHPKFNFTPPIQPIYREDVTSLHGFKAQKFCTFCKKNGETTNIFMDHCVKEKIRDKIRVTCPILRALVCEACGATGDNAHTITYCPVIVSRNNGNRPKSTTVLLKNTRIKSNGMPRF